MHSNTEYRPIEFAEFRLIVNSIVAQQSTDWLAASAQFSPNVSNVRKCFNLTGSIVLRIQNYHRFFAVVLY